MSRSKPVQCRGGADCGVCGDAGEERREREEDARRADEREDPDPQAEMRADEALARADAPALISPLCDRMYCAAWRPCVPCRKKRGDLLDELIAMTEEAGGYDEELPHRPLVHRIDLSKLGPR